MTECGLLTDSSTPKVGVPWDDPLRFCEFVDDAIASVEAVFHDDWRAAARHIYDWAKDAGDDPFATAVRLSLDREAPVETVQPVFRSLCDHRKSLFAQKTAAIAGWSEATAGLGPTGNPDDDIALWAGAWSIVGEAPLKDDIHGACLPSIIRAMRDRETGETGVQVCDEFLQRMADSDDTERAVFAVSVLKDSLAIAENMYSTYKGLFGGVLDILYWPAMARCAGTRVRASLAACGEISPRWETGHASARHHPRHSEPIS